MGYSLRHSVAAALNLAPPSSPSPLPVMYGEMGYVVAEWRKLGRNRTIIAIVATVIGSIGWGWLIVDAKYRTPVPDAVVTAVMDPDGRIIRTYASNRTDPPPPQTVVHVIKDVFFRARRVGSDPDVVRDNWDGLDGYLGDRALKVIREQNRTHPIVEMLNEGKTREIQRMRVVASRLARASYQVFWTEIEKDQYGRQTATHDVEVSATVKTAGCDNPRLEKNPLCVVVDEFQWNLN